MIACDRIETLTGSLPRMKVSTSYVTGAIRVGKKLMFMQPRPETLGV